MSEPWLIEERPDLVKLIEDKSAVYSKAEMASYCRGLACVRDKYRPDLLRLSQIFFRMAFGKP